MKAGGVFQAKTVATHFKIDYQPFADPAWNPFSKTEFVPYLIAGWITILILLVIIFFLSGRYLQRFKNEQPPKRSGPLKPDRFALLFFLVSFFVCLIGIHREALYSLESTYLSEVVPGGPLKLLLFHPVGILNSHNPFYRILLHFLSYISSNLLFLRSISAVGAGLASGLAYQLGRTLINRRAGMAIGAMVSLCPMEIHYGRLLVPYSIMTALILAVTLAFLGAQQGIKRYRIWFPLLLALGLYLHLIFVFFSVILLAYSLLKIRSDRGFGLALLLRGGSAAGLAYASWLLENLAYQVFLHPIFSSMNVYSRFTPLPDSHLLAAMEFFGNVFRIMLGLPYEAYAFGPFLGLAFFIFAWPLIKKKQWELLILGLGPFLTVFAANLWTQSAQFSNRLLWMDRYYLYPHPFLVLMVVAGGWSIVEKRSDRAKRWAAGIVAVFCLAQIPALADQLRRPQFPAMDKAAHRIQELARNGDAVAILPQNFLGDILHYYLMSEPVDLMEWWKRIDNQAWYDLKTTDGSAKVFLIVSNHMMPIEQAASRRAFSRLLVVRDMEMHNRYLEYDEEPFFLTMAGLLKQHKLIHMERFFGVELWVLECRWPSDLRPDQKFILELGRDDYPYIDGFEHDWGPAQNGRRVIEGATIRVKPAAGTEQVRVTLALTSQGEKSDRQSVVPVRLTMGVANLDAELMVQPDSSFSFELKADPARSEFVKVRFGDPEGEAVIKQVAVEAIQASNENNNLQISGVK